MGYYTDFATALAEMSVTGVKKYVYSPPVQVSTAQLPMLFVRLPTTANQVATFGGNVALRQATCEVVILLEAHQQSTTPSNFALALTMMDALEAALTATVNTALIDSWTIRQDVEITGDTTAYWSLVATVTGSN